MMVSFSVRHVWEAGDRACLWRRPPRRGGVFLVLGFVFFFFGRVLYAGNPAETPRKPVRDCVHFGARTDEASFALSILM